MSKGYTYSKKNPAPTTNIGVFSTSREQSGLSVESSRKTKRKLLQVCLELQSTYGNFKLFQHLKTLMRNEAYLSK